MKAKMAIDNYGLPLGEKLAKKILIKHAIDSGKNKYFINIVKNWNDFVGDDVDTVDESKTKKKYEQILTDAIEKEYRPSKCVVDIRWMNSGVDNINISTEGNDENYSSEDDEDLIRHVMDKVNYHIDKILVDK